jgi:outer membrane protein TolC
MNILVKSKGKPIVTLFFLCSSLFTSAQYVTDSMVLGALNSDKLLPLLIDSAIKHNPEVKRVDNSIGLAEENLKMSKNNIYNALSLFSSYHYGTTGNLTSGQVSTITLTQSSYYTMGVGVQLPLTHIISRKSLIRSGEYQVKMAKSEKDGAEEYIKQEVIRVYQELKLAHKLVTVSSEGKQSASINYKMAEKQFLQGDINVTELSRVQDISNKSNIEFETYVNRFQTAWLQLEAFTGVNLSNLIFSLK